MEDKNISEKSKNFIEKYSKNPNFKKYDKDFKKIINTLPLGTVISYVSSNKDGDISFKVGGFLLNRESDYFMLRNVYQSKFVSFPVQYKRLLMMFVRNDKEIEKTKEDLRRLAEKKLKKSKEKDFIIKIKGITYKTFASLDSMKNHITTKTFLNYSKNFNKKNIKFYNNKEELKNIM